MRVHPVAFVIGLLLGFALSQTPEFAQQYRQRRREYQQTEDEYPLHWRSDLSLPALSGRMDHLAQKVAILGSDARPAEG